MNIQGLTPGNWIKEINRFDYDSKEPLSDLEFQIPEYASFIPYKGDSYQPIQLTEEWLLKLGFKKVRDESETEGYHYENEGCWIYLLNGFFEVELITGDERFNLLSKYHYVHQLQNLYFARTGEELKIK